MQTQLPLPWGGSSFPRAGAAPRAWTPSARGSDPAAAPPASGTGFPSLPPFLLGGWQPTSGPLGKLSPTGQEGVLLSGGGWEPCGVEARGQRPQPSPAGGGGGGGTHAQMSSRWTLGGGLFHLSTENWGHSPTFPEQTGAGGGGAQEVTAAATGPVWGLFWRGDGRRRTPFLSCAFLSQQSWWFWGTWAPVGWGQGGWGQGPSQTQGKGSGGPAAPAR